MLKHAWEKITSTFTNKPEENVIYARTCRKKRKYLLKHVQQKRVHARTFLRKKGYMPELTELKKRTCLNMPEVNRLHVLSCSKVREYMFKLAPKQYMFKHTWETNNECPTIIDKKMVHASTCSTVGSTFSNLFEQNNIRARTCSMRTGVHDWPCQRVGSTCQIFSESKKVLPKLDKKIHA